MHVWRLPAARIAQALLALPADRRTLRRLPFGRLLGTASGQDFRTPDLSRWVLVAAWASAAHAEAFERGPLVRRWDRWSRERARIRLSPRSSRGSWSGVEPFGTPTDAPDDRATGGPVAALTRARVRTTQIPRFLRAIPAVAQAISTQSLGAGAPVFRVGIGEAPVGWQGTLSLWRTEADLRAFAYDAPAHAEVVRRTPQIGWYAEELFARFTILGVDGTLDGHPPDFHRS